MTSEMSAVRIKSLRSLLEDNHSDKIEEQKNNEILQVHFFIYFQLLGIIKAVMQEDKGWRAKH